VAVEGFLGKQLESHLIGYLIQDLLPKWDEYNSFLTTIIGFAKRSLRIGNRPR
jgi:hypothetical protein